MLLRPFAKTEPQIRIAKQTANGFCQFVAIAWGYQPAGLSVQDDLRRPVHFRGDNRLSQSARLDGYERQALKEGRQDDEITHSQNVIHVFPVSSKHHLLLQPPATDVACQLVAERTIANDQDP